mgnify:CR=1 FL=1
MATQVIYNGQSFLDLESGKIATLVCGGAQMSTDVEIVFEDSGTVTYNNTTTEANPGQRVTLHCAGQKMLSDIVIHTYSSMYQTLYTVDSRVYTTQEEQTFTVLGSK